MALAASLLLLLLLPVSGLGEAEFSSANDPVTPQGKGSRLVLIVPDSTHSVRLRDRYIDPASFSLRTYPDGTQLIIGRDYTLDPTAGLLELRALRRDTLAAEYRFLPITVTDTLQLRTPLRTSYADSLQREDISPPSSTLQQGGKARYGTNLRRSGHILRGVQVGSGRDLSLESGLRLSLDGQLARDIEVRALLDDRTLPIQPEGTSRRLDEIDQVYVDVLAGRTRGRFGDYHLVLDAGRYGRIDRRLEGGMIEMRQPEWNGRVAGAVTRAQFHSNQFTGRDGVQGPYPLRGRNGEQELIVIGGSEKVWIDGVMRQRGELADYTIDYNRGEITFTTRLPISSESRIEVDFEYSPEAFPRNLYAVETGWLSQGDRLRVAANYAREGDDPDRPIGFEMTPSIRSLLAGADAGQSEAFIPAADSLGTQRGDYSRVDTTWTDGNTYSMFLFKTPDPSGTPNGEWQVTFSESGLGRGDYKRLYDPLLGSYRFEWVGPGNGEWLAARRLPLPELRQNAAFTLASDLTNAVTLSADLGLSSHDPNVFDGTSGRSGAAQAYQLSLHPFRTSQGLEPLKLELVARHEQASFQPFARTREAEYERNWGLDTLARGLAETEYGSSLRFQPNQGIAFQAQYGRLERETPDTSATRQQYLTDRFETGTQVTHRKIRSQLRFQSISSERSGDGPNYSGNWKRANGAISYSLGSYLQPGIDSEWERRHQRTTLSDIQTDPSFAGHLYLRNRAVLGLQPLLGHSGMLYYQQRERDTEVSEGTYQPLYSEWSTGGRWGWKPMISAFFSEVEWNHAEKEYVSSDSANVVSDLAAIRAGWSPLSGAFTSDLNYRLNRTATQASALIAYPVPVGQGEYIRVGDEYIYDPEIGDIVLRAEPTGAARPTTDLSAALDMDWSPHRLPGGKGDIPGLGWEDFSLSTRLEAQEITRHSRASDIYLLRLSHFLTDSTVTGRLFGRQEVHLFRPSPSFNARLRFEAEERLINLYLTGAERFSRESWELRTRHSLNPAVDLENTARLEERSKEFARRGGTDNFTLNRASCEVSWRMSRIWRMSWMVRGLLDREGEANVTVQGLGLRPGLSWIARDKGRVSADFESLWIESDSPVIAYDLADGRPVGRNGRGNLRADLRFGTNMTGRAVYTIRLDEGRAPIHLARVEVSAYF